MLLIAYFTLEKKINSNLRCTLTKKVKKKDNKKVDEVGTVTSTCDRDRSSIMSTSKIFPPHKY